MIDSRGLELLPLTQEEFPHTWKVLDSGLAESVAPGFVVGLWQKKNPNQIWVSGCGMRRVVPSQLPMLAETVFDLASITKVFATATLAAVMVDRGWLDWKTSISSFFPNYPHQKIQIQHLLSHTAGFVAWQPLWEKLREIFSPRAIYTIPVSVRQQKMRELVFSVAPEVQPGERALYSDLSFLILGFVLEEVTQMPLDCAVKKFVWEPMGIRNSFYRRVTQSVKRSVIQTVAATEECPWRGGVLQGQVHDDNCWAMGGYGGHAGAFGTARDLLQFSKRLMEGALSHSTLQVFWTRVSQPPGCERTLGWDTPSGESPSAGSKFSRNSVGHLGFTGTSLWIDLEAQLAVALLSNRVHPTRENVKIKAFRPLFHESLRLDLGG